MNYSIIFRAYDEGVALRYAIDGNGDELQITEEFTGFQLPEGYQKLWGPEHRRQLQRCPTNGRTESIATVRDWMDRTSICRCCMSPRAALTAFIPKQT